MGTSVKSYGACHAPVHSLEFGKSLIVLDSLGKWPSQQFLTNYLSFSFAYRYFEEIIANNANTRIASDLLHFCFPISTKLPGFLSIAITPYYDYSYQQIATGI